jgi:hypothetical protein
MEKINCWEFKKCCREAEGSKADELGTCPAAEEKKLNEVHGGVNGGRACWVVRNTMCDGIIDSNIVEKYERCKECDFMKFVASEEKDGYIFASELFNIMRQLQF